MREGIRQNAYRYVDAAARNRENQLRPPSPLCPVVTRHTHLSNSDHVLAFRAEKFALACRKPRRSPAVIRYPRTERTNARSHRETRFEFEGMRRVEKYAKANCPAPRLSQ